MRSWCSFRCEIKSLNAFVPSNSYATSGFMQFVPYNSYMNIRKVANAGFHVVCILNELY